MFNLFSDVIIKFVNNLTLKMLNSLDKLIITFHGSLTFSILNLRGGECLTLKIVN